MQFTGLKDKKGKEIYEGDIIIQYFRPNEDGSIPRTKPFEVKSLELFFKDVGYAEEEFGESYEPKFLEVIGNIYENKELLK